MALPSRIELCCEVDGRLRLVAWLVWLAATFNLFLYSTRMPLWLLLAAAGMLWWSNPARSLSRHACHRLVLYADGRAQWGEEQGVWLDCTWHSRWVSVVPFRSDNHTRSLWICASRNHADDYRHLAIWCHFSPLAPASAVNDSH